MSICGIDLLRFIFDWYRFWDFRDFKITYAYHYTQTQTKSFKLALLAIINIFRSFLVKIPQNRPILLPQEETFHGLNCKSSRHSH